MSLRYDPLVAPDAAQWLAHAEELRLEAVVAYCEAHEPDLPNVRLHASFHAVIENQIALGDQIPVAVTVRRLMAEGLSRHEAIHAIGTCLADHIYGAFQGDESEPDPQARYFNAVTALTASAWRASGDAPAPVRRFSKRKRRKKRR